MITFAARTREMRPPGAPDPMCGQAVAVVRTEDASVSHERLLTAGGFTGTSFTAHLPVGLEVPVPCERADEPAATCMLPPGPESARRARDFTRVTLGGWDLAAQSDVAELVVSELVTNALRHGLLSASWMPEEHPIGLTLLRRDPYLMCMVTDPESVGPVLIEACASAESGRGLQVVESCSASWGWQPIDGGGKVVWALLHLALLAELRRTTGPGGPGSAASCMPVRRAGRRTPRPSHPG
jgi:hypothetical protein